MPVSASPPDPPTPEEVVLDACRVVVDMHFDGATVDSVQIQGHTATGLPFVVPVEPPSKRRPGRPAFLKSAILEEMQGEQFKRPAKASAIARRMRRACSGHFRQVLTSLVESGELKLVGDGDYWLASRPLPDGKPGVRLADGTEGGPAPAA